MKGVKLLFSNDVEVIRGQSKASALVGCESCSVVQILDLETRLTQAIGIVAAIDTTVVILPKNAGAFGLIGDRIVLECGRAIQLNGRQNDAPTSATHHAIELAHRPQIVLNVLHNMVAENHIEALIFERNLLNIKV